MPNQRKTTIIRAFVRGLADFRASMKADGKLMLEKLSIHQLTHRDELRHFLNEMASAVVDKHLYRDGKVRPQAARLVLAYVKGMLR